MKPPVAFEFETRPEGPLTRLELPRTNKQATFTAWIGAAKDMADDPRFEDTPRLAKAMRKAGGIVAFILYIWVDPRIRGRKVGEELLAEGLAALREMGADVVFLEVAPGESRWEEPLRAFYERAGFEVAPYAQDDDVAYTMVLEFPD